MLTVLQFVGAMVLGGLVGVCELVGRYRDKPASLVKILAAWAYAAVNAGASGIAFGVALSFHWTFGVPSSSPVALGVVRVLATGVGAMAILRTSLLTVRVGNQDVGLGPVAVLTILASATDRATDRTRASERAEVISPLMGELDFARASRALPTYCFQLLQNSTPEEEQAVGNAVRKLESSPDLEDYVKVRALGLQLMGVVGEPVLRKAVEDLRPYLLADSSVNAPIPSRVRQAFLKLTQQSLGEAVPSPTSNAQPPSKEAPSPPLQAEQTHQGS